MHDSTDIRLPNADINRGLRLLDIEMLEVPML